jgi:hypothetical protein
VSVIEKTCARCGSAADAGDKFCGSCGLDLGVEFEPSTREEWPARDPDAHQSWDRAAFGGPPLPPAAGAVSRAVTTTGPDQSRPEKLLGAGGLTISGSSALSAIGSLFLLVYVLANHAPAGVSVATGLDLLFALLLITGFAFIGSGFLARSDAQSGLLRLGTGITAAALFAPFVADSILTGVAAALHAGGTAIAVLVLLALGYLTASVGAVSAAIGFGTSTAANSAKRSTRLGSASIVIATAALLAGVANLIGTAVGSGLGAPGTVTTGAGIEAGGLLILMSAALVAAVGFLLASQRERKGDSCGRVRDVLLAVAMTAAAVSFLLIMIAEMLNAASTASAGADGKVVAAGWLVAVQYFAWVAAAICGAVRFFLSAQRSQA